jgi:NAD(P)H-flavin reductase
MTKENTPLSWLTLDQAHAAGEDSSLLRFSPEDKSFCAQHQKPGQYLSLVLPSGEKGFFALSNVPGTPTVEILVRAGGPAADALRRLSVGGRVQASPPGGPGFPLASARGKDVLLLAQGSGIGALRPVLHEIAARRGDFGAVTLLQGERTQARLSFADEHEAWKAARMEIRPVLSRQAAPYQGHVQQHIEGLPLGRAVVFLVGSREMIALSRLTLARFQVGPDRIFTNF